MSSPEQIDSALKRAAKRIEELVAAHRELQYLKQFYEQDIHLIKEVAELEQGHNFDFGKIAPTLQHLSKISHNLNALQSNKESSASQTGNQDAVQLNTEITRMIHNMGIVVDQIIKAIQAKQIAQIKSLSNGLVQISNQLAIELSKEVSA